MLPAETQLWGPFQLQRCRHRQLPAPMCLEGEQKGRGNGLFHKEKARELAFMPMLCYLVTQTAGRTTYQSRRVSYDLLDLLGLFTSPPHINSPVR